MMKREELTDALRTEAEWAADHDYDIPLMLCGNLQDSATMLESDADEIAALKAENERIRQNSVSQEVSQMMCEERDAAVKDINRIGAEKCLDYRQQTYTSPCKYCKYYAECDFIPTDDGCCFEWHGLQREK